MPDPQAWAAQNLPDLSGKTIIVTGGNSGIGYEAALEFAGKGAMVVLACRSLERGRAAAASIRAAHTGAKIGVMELDLSELASVRGFADAFHRQHRRIDILCNNAGVMAIPYRRTVDGFEMQLGTNHLGHFALTGLLLDLLLDTAGARVVTVSSSAQHIGWIRFDDLQRERGYSRWLAYGQSKLANLLFAFELERRLERAGKKLISVACSPGYAATNLQTAGARMDGSSLRESMWSLSNRLFAISAAKGALPTLYAATSPDIQGGEYIAPKQIQRGLPGKARTTWRAHDQAAASRLWEVSEQLTGVNYVV
jgi:NAD(P)-dependent dehydrogenase (short-subunit alcohol dehydrogenase family)